VPEPTGIEVQLDLREKTLIEEIVVRHRVTRALRNDLQRRR
jgi:aspartyl-tRNA synthetase